MTPREEEAFVIKVLMENAKVLGKILNQDECWYLAQEYSKLTEEQMKDIQNISKKKL